MSANREKDSLRGSVKELYAKTVTLTGKDKDVREEFQSLRFGRYDEAGNKVEEAYLDSDGSLLHKTVWTFDAAGKLVEQANSGANESPTFKTIFEYDDAGRLIEKKMFNSLSEGIQKFIIPAEVRAGRFTKIGLPSPEILAPFVGTFEIVCGSLILLGLFTRIAAVPLIVIMLVAIASTKMPILFDKGFWAMAHEAS